MFLSCRASATPRLDLTRVASTSPRPPSSPRYLLSPPVFSSSNLRFPPLLRNLLRNLSYLVHAIDASHRGKKIIKNGHPLSRVWKAARPCNTFGAGSSSSVDPTIPRVCISVRGTTTRIDGLLEDRESRFPRGRYIFACVSSSFLIYVARVNCVIDFSARGFSMN